MDFYEIKEDYNKRGKVIIYPDFVVNRSKDLMVRGKSFYAVWDEEAGLWSTDEYDVKRLVDKGLTEHYDKNFQRFNNSNTFADIKYLSSFSSNSWVQFKKFMNNISDNYKPLDEKITFANTPVNKKDYVSRRLPYSLDEGNYDAYEELISTLYDPEERAKLEWAIGSIINGDSKRIQKFIVLYGDPGSGKSTVLEIIQKLFEGYYTVFDAKSLTSNNNAFATERFKSNPLVAIQHDGDLSRIEDNTKLNSIVSHEEIVINEKYKSEYSLKTNCFLFMATNKPVKITDGKAGLIRRLIDVRPSGRKVPTRRYNQLMKIIAEHELGAIANHCLEVYEEMGRSFYNSYRPLDMMYKTDPFFNFIDYYSHEFKTNDGVTLKAAYSMYKEYCKEANVDYQLQMYKFREELKNYFREFANDTTVDGVHVRSYYSGFMEDKLNRSTVKEKPKEEPYDGWLKFEKQKSVFDNEYDYCLAQYATDNETPSSKWSEVKMNLRDINTSKLHYVKVPMQHIVIDFDLKDDSGKKSFEKNLEKANEWPKTYAELSKSGAGIHLHYIYTGERLEDLARVYDKDIEIKVFTGNSSLRRKLTKCNDLPITEIKSGLPFREVKKSVINEEGIKSEKVLRSMIIRNLNKEIHPGTKPSIDFIKKLLDDAYNSGLKYDVSDMRSDITAFASQSTHQAIYCLSAVEEMHFQSDEASDGKNYESDDRIVFYDVEVFPNLFLINWKYIGEENPVVRMINPKPEEVEELCRHKLVGYNCRRYDNHILYGRIMGYSNEMLFDLSQRIINKSKDAFFSEAYNISYTDIYDYASTKQSLKLWEIQLGIHHLELGLPWDKPVPEEKWLQVAEYCDNDVISTEAVWNATQGDFTARMILADLANMTVNDSTNSLTTRIIMGKDRKPSLVYTDLATGEQEYMGVKSPTPKGHKNDFPGYEFKFSPDDNKWHNMYRDTDLGMGGYVYSIADKPNGKQIWLDVALLDIASLHPHSAIELNAFGEYTENFQNIVQARIHIKHKEYDKVKEMFDGRLAKYLNDPTTAKQLAQALKIAINSVYGLTSAAFDNPFRDNRNKNNIIALRGALFMRTLQDEVEKRGYTVAHIKTDSIKIPDAKLDIIEFCFDFAKQYGYTFEHEATYQKMCLVNDAVYIARYASQDFCMKQYNYIPEKNQDHPGEWTATGTQFQVPYVFKKLFSHEEIEFSDMCEAKSVKTAIYLDMNEDLPDAAPYEKMKAISDRKRLDSIDYWVNGNLTRVEQSMASTYGNLTDEEIDLEIAKGHSYKFIGKVGEFCPIKPGCGGGWLMAERDGKYNAVTGSKGYRWLESEVVRAMGREGDVDERYYEELCEEAIKTINEYGDFEEFAKND